MDGGAAYRDAQQQALLEIMVARQRVEDFSVFRQIYEDDQGILRDRLSSGSFSVRSLGVGGACSRDSL